MTIDRDNPNVITVVYQFGVEEIFDCDLVVEDDIDLPLDNSL